LELALGPPCYVLTWPNQPHGLTPHEPALAEKSEGIAIMSDGVTRVKAAISELVAAFPAVFTLDPMLVRPLKLGIKDDL
jgi:RNA chaperone ProQ/FINO-like protein